MGLLIFIGIFLFISIMVQSRESKNTSGYTGKRAKTWCPPHKWDYNTSGQLQCLECRKTPEYSSRE